MTTTYAIQCNFGGRTADFTINVIDESRVTPDEFGRVVRSKGRKLMAAELNLTAGQAGFVSVCLI